MRSLHGGLIAIVAMTTAACGGGGGGEPLVSGSVSGAFAGDAFTADVGVATVVDDTPVIGLGTGNLNCDSPNHDEPPSGITAIIGGFPFTIGDYTDVYVELDKVSGNDFNGIGTGGGTVSLIAVGDTIAGTVDWSFTDPDDGSMYSLTGPFEVVNCQ